ncbi:restriction endonuclease [Halogeometricum borinquense]|uniref:restriction endonuclease n=1 Tax=Halogeometricum borinquense TaxID=60847 RepID=UPI003423BB0B
MPLVSKQRIQGMDNEEFEHFVADLYERMGWDCTVTDYAQDQGIDIIATKSVPYSQKKLIQAKRYSDSNPVSGPDVQQYASLKQQEQGVDSVIIVTTGRFTQSAIDLAENLNVKLVDGDDLVSLIEAESAGNLVEEYLGYNPSEFASKHNASSSVELEVQTESDGFGDLRIREEEALKKAFGEDYEDEIKKERYHATRAVEQARGKVTLNPHDAQQIGAFDELPDKFKLHRFDEQLVQYIAHGEDLHMSEEGNLFISDITEYVPAKYIDTDASGPIIGELQKGVKDGSWLTQRGRLFIKRLKKSDDKLIGGIFDIETSEDSGWYHYLVFGGVTAFIGAIFFAGIIPLMPPLISGLFRVLWAVGFLGGLIAVPVGLYLDTKYAQQHVDSWNPSTAGYLIGMTFLPFILLPWYALQRYRHIGF